MLEIRKSLLPGAGWGVFVVQPGGIQKGDPITEYDGCLYSRSDALAVRCDPGKGHWKSLELAATTICGLTFDETMPRDYLDGRGAGSLVNDCGYYLDDDGEECYERSCPMFNAKYELSYKKEHAEASKRFGTLLTHRCTMLLIATKFVAFGDEVYVPYGRSYWAGEH